MWEKSLRSSNGTAISPLPNVSPAPKVIVASAMRRPLSSKAPAVTCRGAGLPGARVAESVKPDTSFSAAVRPTMPRLSGTAQSRLAGSSSSSVAKASRSPGAASPSASNAIEALGSACNSPATRANTAGRSTGTGRGSATFSLSRAAAASNGPMSAFGFSAVKASMTGTPVELASAISRFAVATRCSQSGALAQPLSMTSTSASPPVGSFSRGFQIGSASAVTINAAISSLSNVSHHGLWCGVSSFFRTRASILSGGNTSVCGFGGVSRSSHQITGRASRPHRIAGKPKLSGSQLMPRYRRQIRFRPTSPCAPAPARPRPAGRYG